MYPFIMAPSTMRRRGDLSRSVRDARVHAAVMSPLQRTRVLEAALREASDRGWQETSLAAIVGRARVSRKTFYDLFESRDDCFAAAFEEALARMGRVAGHAYAVDGAWPLRLRAALVTLLECLEADRDLGSFTLGQLAAPRSVSPERRLRALELLRSAVDEGRSYTRARHEISPLAAEAVVGGVLAVVHGHLLRGSGPLTGLANSLMWIIVLPYLGPATAALELTRTLPSIVGARAEHVRSPLDGLDMRVTYRTARVLQALTEKPGASNVELADRADIIDQGQISKLLARLRRLELIENTETRAAGVPNCWRLTPKGEELGATIARRVAVAGVRASRRGDG
jgi:AcrR family transcriptional regulator